MLPWSEYSCHSPPVRRSPEKNVSVTQSAVAARGNGGGNRTPQYTSSVRERVRATVRVRTSVRARVSEYESHGEGGNGAARVRPRVCVRVTVRVGARARARARVRARLEVWANVRVMARVQMTVIVTVIATATRLHLSFVDLHCPRCSLGHNVMGVIVVPQHSRGVTVAELQSPASHHPLKRRTIAVPRITTSRRCRKVARSARHQTASTT